MTMKSIETFESYSSRESMMKELSRKGYSMKELQNLSNKELQNMCGPKGLNDSEEEEEELSSANESNSSRESMCNALCRKGYSMKELQYLSDKELQNMCRNMSNDSEEEEEGNMAWANESKIQKLSNKMKKDNKSNTNNKKKNKDNKVNKAIKEHQETENYMFFANLENMKRMIDEILEMDSSKIDHILSDGHNWAVDHVATSKDDIEEVFNFLSSHDEPTHEETESEMKGIKSFIDFKK